MCRKGCANLNRLLGTAMDQEEKQRYSRQVSLDGFGLEGQEKLLSSKVAVVGCGALGSMVAMQLAGAGVGKLVIADYDTVDISNLQRQYFFDTADAGRRKSEILADRIRRLNPGVCVEAFDRLVDKEFALNLLADVDFVIDATDNPSSKAMIEEVSGILSKPCCIAGVSGFHGQVMTILPGDMRFTDLFDSIGDGGVLPCSLSGVIGPAAALCASVQSAEAIKYITGSGATLQGKMFVFNLRDNSYNVYGT